MSYLNNSNYFVNLRNLMVRPSPLRNRSEITGGGGEILGGSLFFLPKLREGHNFFIAKPADLNQSVLVTIFQLTGPSA